VKDFAILENGGGREGSHYVGGFGPDRNKKLPEGTKPHYYDMRKSRGMRMGEKT